MRRIGDKRRRGGDRPAQRKQRMRARRSRQPVDADQVDQDQDRLADEPEGERASDRDLGGKRQLRRARSRPRPSRPCASRRRWSASRLNRNGTAIRLTRLDEPQSASAADQRQNEPPSVDDECDRRPGRVEAPDVRPGPRQLPEPDRIIALKGEDREGGRVERDQRRGKRPLGPGPAQERQARRRRRPRRGSAARARPRRKSASASSATPPSDGKRGRPARKRARQGSRRLHASRRSYSPPRLPCGLSRESQACFERLPGAP